MLEFEDVPELTDPVLIDRVTILRRAVGTLPKDLYQGIEFERGSAEAAALRGKLRELAGFEVREDAGITLKPISVAGTRRIVRFALEYARANRRHKVTLGHKSNVMRYSDGLFFKTFLDIASNPNSTTTPASINGGTYLVTLQQFGYDYESGRAKDLKAGLAATAKQIDTDIAQAK